MFIDVISAHLDDFWPGVFAMGLGGRLRPPEGAPGLVDWRLGGAISRMIIDERISGEWGEQSLVWSNRRNSKIYIIGLGKKLPLKAEQTTRAANQLVASLVKAGERQALLIPDPILHGPGGKGAEGPFFEGALEAISAVGKEHPDFRLIVPADGKDAARTHESFRKAILRAGTRAEGVNLEMIEGPLAGRATPLA